MRFTTDIVTKEWSFDEEDLKNFYLDVKFAFRDNGKLPVVFDELSFGYSLKLNSKKVSEDSLPLPGVTYISTDQDYVEGFLLPQLVGGKEYFINVWTKNAGDFWEYSTSFVMPMPISPYPSWTFDEESGMWVPPIPYPDDDGLYDWDEESQNWVPFEISQ